MEDILRLKSLPDLIQRRKERHSNKDSGRRRNRGFVFKSVLLLLLLSSAVETYAAFDSKWGQAHNAVWNEAMGRVEIAFMVYNKNGIDDALESFQVTVDGNSLFKARSYILNPLWQSHFNSNDAFPVCVPTYFTQISTAYGVLAHSTNTIGGSSGMSDLIPDMTHNSNEDIKEFVVSSSSDCSNYTGFAKFNDTYKQPRSIIDRRILFSDGDDSKRAFHVVYWYPPTGWLSSNKTVRLKFSVQAREYASSSSSTLVYSSTYTGKTIDLTLTSPIRNASIKTQTYNTDGTASFSFQGIGTNVEGNDYLYFSSYKNLRNNTTYTRAMSTISSQSQILNGYSPSYFMDKDNNRTHYSVSDTKTELNSYSNYFRKSFSFTYPKAATLETFTGEVIDCYQVKLNWNVLLPSDGGTHDKNNFILERLIDGAWEQITTISYVDKKEQYTYNYTIPDAELAKGKKELNFRVSRPTIVPVSSTARNQWFTKEATVSVNTDFAVITSSTMQRIDGTNTAGITWEIGEGLWCGNDSRYELWLNGAKRDDIEAVDSQGKKTTSYTLAGLQSCTKYNVELRLYNAKRQSAISTVAVNKEFLYKETNAEILSFDAAKGYYSNRVVVDWQIDENKSDFAKFILYRRDLSNDNPQTILLQEFIHDQLKTSYTYEDNTADPGIFYEYTLEGITACDDEMGIQATLKTIGFSQAYGSVSGRITYTGSQPVNDVQVLFEGQGDFANRSLYFQGNVGEYLDIPLNVFNDDKMTFQAWLNLEESPDHERQILYWEAWDPNSDYSLLPSDPAYRANFALTQKGNRLYLSDSDSRLGEMYTHIDSVEINKTGYFHLTFAMERIDDNSATITFYVDGEKRLSRKANIKSLKEMIGFYVGSPVGMGFLGNIDEIRFWNVILSESEVKSNYDRYQNGKESGLLAYYRADEALKTGYVYDCSAVKSNFNKNHAKVGSGVNIASTTVPTANQLSFKAVTDARGNYLINNLPYASDGTSYVVTPSLGVHQFDASSRPLYISKSSNAFNNIDFTDVSSFELSGKVVYEGGNYPVEGCSFEVDGKILVRNNGSVVTSTSDGSFTIEVPIGIHEVRVVKQGHTFANDGLVLDAEGNNYNYNGHRTLTEELVDVTRVKLLGRVVGGLAEHNKALGFGESINNIGVQRVTLTPAKEQYDLFENETKEKVLHNNGQWKKTVNVKEDSTLVTFKQKSVEITISGETGEFVAMLPPIAYIIGEIEEQGVKIYSANESLDLTSTPVAEQSNMQQSIRQWTDSVLVSGSDLRPGELPYKKEVQLTDTILYHAKWQHYYQAIPSFAVQQLEGNTKLSYLGDELITVTDPDTQKEVELPAYYMDVDTVKYSFGIPLFTQGKSYEFAFNAFEEYVNHRKLDDDDNPLVDRKPISGGLVNITNTMKKSSAEESISLDSSGNGTYKFTAMSADLTTGQRSFMATLQIEGRNYNWMVDGRITPEPQVVWLLGDESTGTDFMTSGPDELTAILRDPPGSLSYAYIEKGTTFTQTKSNSVTEGFLSEINVATELGGAITTFAGLGAGVIMDTEISLNTDIGQSTETKYQSGNEQTTTTTFTERFQTSSDPLYVGSNGDVFVGNSTNIQYGLTNSIAIRKGNPENDALSSEGVGAAAGYYIGKGQALAFGQQFGTRFAYTQIQLEEVMIPKWKDNLSLLLKSKGYTVDPSLITTPVYVSNLERADKNFGKLNIDKKAFPDADLTNPYDGESYTVIFPSVGWGNESDNMKNFQDSIVWYNNNINRWTQVLAQNEKEKLEMQKLGNYSFGSGASIEWSQSKSVSKTTSYEHTFVLSPSLGLTTGVKVCGIGVNMTTKTTDTTEDVESGSEGSETTMTTGFVLEEEGDDDQLTVDYGWTASGTIAFKTRGGRTSCPYEGLEVVRYYEPKLGEILNEATMRIEVPAIDVVGTNRVLNVPANRPAIFTLELKNNSETGEDVWFQLRVDEETNPDGAELKIDGQSISNGRTFLVKADEPLYKTVSVYKGANATVYNNIGLILHSQCQFDPTDFLENISDTTWVSVQYIPGSSDVSFDRPSNNWIVNTETGDSLKVALKDFDVNFENFGYVGLEYRSTASSTWSTLMKFYADETLFSKATGEKTLLAESDQTIDYTWNLKEVTEGTYELRAFTTSLDATGLELSRYTTDALSGIKDMKKPQPLGNPSPANGILNIGDEISILFNEEIRQGMVTDNQISIRGVLNGTTIANPNVGLNFRNTGFAYTEMPITTNGSFSIESWFIRTPGTGGTLFAFGSNGNYISLGFNNTGNAVVKLGENIYTSSGSIADTDEWKYAALVYDASNMTMSVYVLEGTKTNALFDGQSLTSAVVQPEKQGRLYVGAMADKSSVFSGTLSGIHFWNTKRTVAQISADKNTIKSGRENSLIGYWNLDEGKGTMATDKARSRHLTLETDWYIYPQGKSAKVSGNDYLSLPSGEFPFLEYDDFSVEFWFKGADQTSATLFSVGHGVKDTYTDGKLSIAINVNKELVLRSKGQENVVTGNKVLDNQWHHLAFTVKRSGISNIYIDGKLTQQFNSQLIGSLEGGIYSFGACAYNYMNGQIKTDAVDDYFTGCFDDIRVWNAVLNKEVIERNMNYKLRGDENGLLAYYPFDKYATDGTVLSSNLDFVSDSKTMNGFVVNDDVPAIMDCRPMETIPYPSFSYVTSNNKIVISIDETYKERIEGTVLEISVKDIYDLQNNKSDVQIWTAYVNQNALTWGDDAIELVMEEGAHRSFTTTIINKAGDNTDYIIENVPEWLTINQSQGTLKPTASKEITFTIPKETNIGSYEAAISLTGANGISVLLPVTLKVTGERPDWTVNPHDYSASMNVIGGIQIEGAPQEDGDDLLGAFINDVCIGVTSPIYISSRNSYYVFMDIYGNDEHDGKAIVFKLWDASTGRIYPKVVTKQDGSELTIAFKSNETRYASLSKPIEFNALNIIEQQIALKSGWNWMSANVTNDNPALLDQFKERVAANCVTLKSQTGFVEATNNGGSLDWHGTLSAMSVAESYLTMVNQSQTLKLEGKPANVTQTDITLNSGWSWIGYTPQVMLPVNTALAGFEAVNGDQIKTQNGFSVYDSNNGWIGSLTYMTPGKGYMYYSENNQEATFHYPNVVTSQRALAPMRVIDNDVASKWNCNFRRFANNMTFTAIALLDGVELKSDLVEIAAFAGDDCRGNILLSYTSGLDHDYLGFLMVYGEDGDEIHFRMYDHTTGKEYINTSNRVSFRVNDRHGNALNPYQMNFSEVTSVSNAERGVVSIYPNPVVDILYVDHSADEIECARIFDASGRMIMASYNVVDKFLNVSDLEAGIYLLKLTIYGQEHIYKFTKK